MSIVGRAELWLPRGEYSGSGDWLDKSGNGHNATPNGAVYRNGGWDLDGVSDFLEIPDHANLNYAETDDFSLLYVARAADPGGDTQSLIMKYNGQADPGWWSELHLSSVLRGLSTRDGVTNFHDPTTTPVIAGQEFIGGGVHTPGATLESFLDGVGTGDFTFSPVASYANSLNIQIGVVVGSGDLPFEGTFYAVALWREGLTSNEMVQAGLELSQVSNRIPDRPTQATIPSYANRSNNR